MVTIINNENEGNHITAPWLFPKDAETIAAEMATRVVASVAANYIAGISILLPIPS